MLFIFAFVISLVVTMLLIPPIMRWADKIGAIDIPNERKVHTTAIPRVGGIAMVIGSVISILVLSEFSEQTIAVIIGFVVIWGFGLWDDKCDLNYKIKFVGQIVAVVIVVYFGDIVITSLPFMEEEVPYVFALPFTVFALVGITNAINLSDGLDGLAGGTSLITISIIALLAYDSGGSELVIMCMAVAGSILGFLRHNTYPARLFMGDTGSQFLGFSLGVFVILLSQYVNSAMSPIIPLLILGLPILDTIAVMTQRLYEKKSPFSPDKNHMHHKLLGMGLDQYEAVFIIYLLQTSLVTCAYFFLYESDIFLSAIYCFISICVLGAFHLASVTAWRFHSDKASSYSFLSAIVKTLRENGLLTSVPTYALMVLIPSILILSSFFVPLINIDMSILAAILFIMYMVSIFANFQKCVILEKAVVYVASVMAVYHMSLIDNELVLNNIVNILYFVIALAFAIRIRFSHEKTFQVTPLDYLVIILIIVVPNLPEVHLEDSNIGEMAIKLVILFYAAESILGMAERNRGLIRIGVMMSLMIIFMRGI